MIVLRIGILIAPDLRHDGTRLRLSTTTTGEARRRRVGSVPVAITANAHRSPGGTTTIEIPTVAGHPHAITLRRVVRMMIRMTLGPRRLHHAITMTLT